MSIPFDELRGQLNGNKNFNRWGPESEANLLALRQSAIPSSSLYWSVAPTTRCELLDLCAMDAIHLLSLSSTLLYPPPEILFLLIPFTGCSCPLCTDQRSPEAFSLSPNHKS